jgi:PPOX class probable F420-dependent enzyme
MSMSADERNAFLNQVSPTPLGVVGTVRANGAPQVTPVWFYWSGETITVWTTDTRAWVKNVRRDPRIAFSVQTAEAPYPAVVFRGTASVATGDTPEIHDAIRRITTRYVEPQEIESYITDWPELRTIVTITPTHTTAWAEGG